MKKLDSRGSSASSDDNGKRDDHIGTNSSQDYWRLPQTSSRTYYLDVLKSDDCQMYEELYHSGLPRGEATMRRQRQMGTWQSLALPCCDGWPLHASATETYILLS